MIEAPAPLAAPVIDTHTHLDVHDRDLHGSDRPDVETLLALAAQVNVTRIVQIGCDETSARLSVEMAQGRDNVVVGVGIHPNDAARTVERHGTQRLEESLRTIEALSADPKVRGIGETGLDYFRTGPELRPVQQESFRWHIDLAKRTGKALVIHDRDSHDDVLAILDEVGAPETVIFHCFSGDRAMAVHCAARGWFMSFAGVLTYKNNDVLREACLAVPDDLVLVETDAPYLTPVPFRGKPNASYLMPHTVRFMAELRGTDEATMANTLTANALRAFGAWG